MFDQLPNWGWFAVVGGAVLFYLYKQKRWPLDVPISTPTRTISVPVMPVPNEPAKVTIPTHFQLVPVTEAR